jgi:cytochrome oxidase assembly protein ShyY1
MASTELQHTADPAFRRVRLHGQFDAAHSLLLDNRQRDGKVGVELLQPFQDQAAGLWLLVNRGWLPWPDRRTPPQFTTLPRP